MEKPDWADLLDKIVAGFRDAGLDDADIVDGLVERIKGDVDTASSCGDDEKKKPLLGRIKASFEYLSTTIAAAATTSETVTQLTDCLSKAKDAILGLF